MNRHFSEEVQMGKKYMGKCSTSLAIKEIKIKIKDSISLKPEWPSSRKHQHLLMMRMGAGGDITVGGNVN
jgi:hypothetical protein